MTGSGDLGTSPAPARRLRIVQAVREIKPSGGVSGVAYALEQELRGMGVETSRITLDSLHRARRSRERSRLGRWLSRTRDVLLYTVVGTWHVTRLERADRDAVVISHNDAVAGRVHVNHGLLVPAMRRRGSLARAVVSNPLVGFLFVREWFRYAANVHDLVISLNEEAADEVRRSYPRYRGRHAVIGNGVDVNRFRPSSAGDRRRGRAELGLDPSLPVVLFVGYEFRRKGLHILIDALAELDMALQLVVVGGGSDEEIAAARAYAAGKARAVLLGNRDDVDRIMPLADVFCLPSAYEAGQLVLLEALACGVPVVASGAGNARELLEGTRAGVVCERTPRAVAAALRTLLTADDAEERALGARRIAEAHSWEATAARYVEEISRLGPRRRRSRGRA